VRRRLTYSAALLVATGFLTFGFAGAQKAAADDVVPSGGSIIPKVLVMPREGSEDVGFMLKHEVEPMLGMLKEAGFTPVIASASGSPFDGGGQHLDTDLSMREVIVSQYVGVLLPCMAAGTSRQVPEEAVRIVREAAAAGKPIAAQQGSVLVLDAAGLLDGRRYAMASPMSVHGIYAGYGVVRDGNIVTSGVCPMQAMERRRPDGTQELARQFIQMLSGR